MQQDVIIDLETTGKRSFNAHVIETGLVVHDSKSKEVDHFHVLANPGEEALKLASPKALEVNGISLDEVRTGIPINEAAVRLHAFLAKYPGYRMHSFNNEFDMWFLARPPWSIPEKSWGECIMVAAMEIMRDAGVLDSFANGTPKWPSLDMASQFFGVTRGAGHRALPDARRAAAVYTEIKKRRSRSDAIVLSEAEHMIEDGM